MTPTTEAPEKLTVSIAEASTISGFSRVVIRTAIKRGELKSLLPHGYVCGRRIKKAELFKWMKENGGLGIEGTKKCSCDFTESQERVKQTSRGV